MLKTESWELLKNHYDLIKDVHMRTLFKDPARFKNFSIDNKNLGILLDYSKNRIDSDTISLLLKLAQDCSVLDEAQATFNGKKINFTEGRAVLHTALRRPSGDAVMVDGQDVMPEILAVRKKMKAFSDSLRSGQWKGYSGKKIDTIVNIGIGGSDLGPRMVCEALKFLSTDLRVLFVSNVDAADILETLRVSDPETTLFMVASKTFTTQETLTNAFTARDWLVKALGEAAVRNHFVALSTNKEKVSDFGIDPANMFEFWDFVGGRYSLCSAIGLSIACFLGYEVFEEILEGANAMDKHFIETPYDKNIPIILAMLGIWYNNFFSCETHAILPYSNYLNRFPAYFQQGDMESNGKCVDKSGKKISGQTGPIIWGEPGTNGQHSFYQLLHQGTKLIPSDFIAFVNPPERIGDHHEKLMANCFAQTEALAFGLGKDELIAALKKESLSDEKIQLLSPYRIFEGNRPSNTILLDNLTPRTLGMLISMYEHKIFTQGIVWGLNSFDQWGVELGKKMASIILPELTSAKTLEHDQSTSALISHYINNKRA